MCVFHGCVCLCVCFCVRVCVQRRGRRWTNRTVLLLVDAWTEWWDRALCPVRRALSRPGRATAGEKRFGVNHSVSHTSQMYAYWLYWSCYRSIQCWKTKRPPIAHHQQLRQRCNRSASLLRRMLSIDSDWFIRKGSLICQCKSDVVLLRPWSAALQPGSDIGL